MLLCLERKHKRKESRGLHEIRIDMEDIRYREILPAVECSISNLPDSDGILLDHAASEHSDFGRLRFYNEFWLHQLKSHPYPVRKSFACSPVNTVEPLNKDTFGTWYHTGSSCFVLCREVILFQR